ESGERRRKPPDREPRHGCAHLSYGERRAAQGRHIQPDPPRRAPLQHPLPHPHPLASAPSPRAPPACSRGRRAVSPAAGRPPGNARRVTRRPAGASYHPEPGQVGIVMSELPKARVADSQDAISLRRGEGTTTIVRQDSLRPPEEPADLHPPLRAQLRELRMRGGSETVELGPLLRAVSAHYHAIDEERRGIVQSMRLMA